MIINYVDLTHGSLEMIMLGGNSEGLIWKNMKEASSDVLLLDSFLGN